MISAQFFVHQSTTHDHNVINGRDTLNTRLHDCTDCTKLCNTVYYAVLLMMNDQIRSKHVEQTTNCGIRIKIDYNNCAFRLLLTHCNMMHGTHNVKITQSVYFFLFSYPNGLQFHFFFSGYNSYCCKTIHTTNVPSHLTHS